MNDVSFLGEYRCSELSPAQLDGILAFALNREDIEAARPLHQSAWWDYRFVHPGQRFFLYSHCYAEAIRKWQPMFGMNPYIGSKLSDHPVWRTERVKGLPTKGNLKALRDGPARVEHHLTPASYRTGLWRGMCHADEYGVPYELWIKWAFEFAFENKFQRMPNPSGLYSAPMVRFVAESWETHQAELMAAPKDPRYLAANYVGDETQRAFQRWLLKLIKARPQPAIALTHYLSAEPLVHLDTARTILGDHIVGDALKRI